MKNVFRFVVGVYPRCQVCHCVGQISDNCCSGESWNGTCHVCVYFVSLSESNDRVLVGLWNCHENRFPQRQTLGHLWNIMGEFWNCRKNSILYTEVTENRQKFFATIWDLNDAAVFSTVTSQQESSWVKFRLGPFLCGVWTTLEYKNSELPPTVQRHVNWWF